MHQYKQTKGKQKTRQNKEKATKIQEKSEFIVILNWARFWTWVEEN